MRRVRYLIRLPVAYTGGCTRAKTKQAPLTPLLSVPRGQFRLRKGQDLLEGCGPWRLCGVCGTAVFFEDGGSTVSALACTIDWPGQDCPRFAFGC